MRQAHRFALCMLLVMMLSSVSTARATERVEAPTYAPIHTLRLHFLRTFNGKPLRTCHDDFENLNRIYGVCHDLADGPGLTAGKTIEEVFYDGTVYTRINGELPWTKDVDELYGQNLGLDWLYSPDTDNGVWSNLGSATVGGRSTTHYQFWSLDSTLNANVGGQYVFDSFVSDDNIMRAYGFSYRGDIKGLGQGEMKYYWENVGTDEPISISPPPASEQ